MSRGGNLMVAFVAFAALVAACASPTTGGGGGTDPGLAGQACTPNGAGSFIVGTGTGTVQITTNATGEQVVTCVPAATTTTSTSTTTSTTTTTVPCPDPEAGSPTSPIVFGALNLGASVSWNGRTCTGDSDWFQIRVNDPSSACLTSEQLTVSFRLVPGGPGDADLYLWNAPGQLLTGSTARGTTTDQINYSWSGSCFADDSRTFLIEVRAFNGIAAGGDPYSLSVFGLTEN